MPLLDITDESFKTLYKEHDIIILDFWAIWCGPCQQFAPTFEKVSKQYPDIIFGKVETETQMKLSQYFAVRSIPTILIIKEELEIFRHSGVIGEDDLIKIIEDAKVADMDKVREQIEKEESSRPQ